MGVEVDSVIVDLEARIGKYRTDLTEAISLQQRYQDGWEKPIRDAGTAVVAENAKAAAKETVQAEEQATQQVTRTRKARSDTAKQAAVAEASAAKEGAAAFVSAEKDKQAAIAATQRAMAQAATSTFRDAITQAARGPLEITSPVLARATGFENGKNPFQSTSTAVGTVAAQNAEMARTSAGQEALTATAAQKRALAEGEINDRAIAQLGLKAQILAADKADTVAINDQLYALRQYGQYRRLGLEEAEAQARVDAELLAIEEKRARAAGQGSPVSSFGKNALRFGEGAGLGRSYGSTATVAGIGTAIAAGATIEAVSSSIDYAKQIKDTAAATGLTTQQVQIYSAAAKQAGVSTEQFQSGLGQLNASLGKAKLGDDQAAKAFSALGINIKTAGSAGDVLPTVIDRLSKIADPAQRAAVETRLFGEEGRRLDALLSGGNQKVNDLADGLIRTGAVLSSSDIQKLGETSEKLAQVKAQLEVDLAQVVAGNADAITSLAKAVGTLAGEIIHFLGSNPGAALALMGAIGGGVVGGLPGAAIGAVAGFASGPLVKKAQDDQNTDVAFRQRKLKEAQDSYASLHSPTTLSSLFTVHSSDSDGSAGDVRRQQQLLASAQAKAKASAGAPNQDAFNKSVQSGNNNAAALAKLFAPKGPKGKSTQTLYNEEQDRQKRFTDELAEANARYLKAETALALGSEAQFKFQEDAIKAARDKQDADYDIQENTKKIDAGKAKELKAANDAAAAEQLKVVALQRQVEAYNLITAAAERQYAFQAEILSIQGTYADTSKKRLDLAVQQIDLEQKQAQAKASATILSPDPKVSDADRAAAEDDYRNAGTLADAQRAAAKRQNETPGQQYARSLKATPDTIQSSEVKILQDFNSQLDQSVSKALHLHGIFGSIVDDLIDMAIKQALIAPLANSLFPTGGAGGGGGLFGSLFKSVGGLFGGGLGAPISGIDTGGIESFGIPGFATGGSGVIGGNDGTDQNVLSINGKPQARVGKGELLSVSPNGIAPDNSQARSGTQQNIVVVQPINANFAGARTDEQTMRQFMNYADAKSAQAYQAAVKTSGGQVSGIVQRKQTLGS